MPQAGPLPLASGVLTSAIHPVQAGRAMRCLKQACEAGALQWLVGSFMASTPFQDDVQAQKELYAGVVHQLLMTLLDATCGRQVC